MFLTEEEITLIMKEAPLRIKLIVVARKAATLWVRVFLGPLPHGLQMKIYEKAWRATRKIWRKANGELSTWMVCSGLFGPIV